jgi:hypothetical protein
VASDEFELEVKTLLGREGGVIRPIGSLSRCVGTEDRHLTLHMVRLPRRQRGFDLATHHWARTSAPSVQRHGAQRRGSQLARAFTARRYHGPWGKGATPSVCSGQLAGVLQTTLQLLGVIGEMEDG